MKIFVIGNSYSEQKLWEKFGHEIVDNIGSAEGVQFTGGEDVTPSYYGEPKHPHTYNNPARDMVERAIFQNCFERNIPMFGICRGGQFLNVMSGGKMLQHVTNHTQDHVLEDVQTGKKLLVSSTHHQMMVPGEGAEIVGIANQEGEKHYHDKETGQFIRSSTVMPPDIEVLFYPLTNCLCFQPHPEFNQSRYEPMQQYYFELINRYILEKA